MSEEELDEFLGGDVPELGEWTGPKKEEENSEAARHRVPVVDDGWISGVLLLRARGRRRGDRVAGLGCAFFFCSYSNERRHGW